VIQVTSEKVDIRSESDLIIVRKTVRNIVESMGFGVTDVTRIVTAVSELARNIYLYAGTGYLQCREVSNGHAGGIELTFIDDGPGIPDIPQALEVGYTTGGGLGMGLPGAKRLMDEMEIESQAGKGTTIIIRKWLKS
jgi:serine/threonine-protein kinase RsbT